MGAASLAIFSYGCRKEKNDLKFSNEGIAPSTPIYYNLPIIINPHPILNLIINLDDADDQKISENLLALAEVGKNVFIDNRFNQEVFLAANGNDNACKSLLDFVSSISMRNIAPNVNSFDSLKHLVETIDLTHLVDEYDTNGLVIGTHTEQYIPAIFVVNREIADMPKQPILSSGIYVNPEIPDLENYESYIVAWILDTTEGGYIEILINEEMAMNTPNPIFIFDNAENDITYRPKQVFLIPDDEENEPNSVRRNMNTSRYDIHEYRINHRYERYAASEFWVAGAHINHNGQVQLICRRSNGTYNTDKVIKNVSKNDIGKVLTTWENLCRNSVTPFASNYVFWNTFERDWAKSSKDLGDATRNGTTINIYGNRTFSREWYTYKPAEVKNNPLNLNQIYWNWSLWHEYHEGKGRLRVHRIQP